MDNQHIHNRIDDVISRLEARYNGDNDIIPNAPVVTYSDMTLLSLVKDLQLLIRILECELEEHEHSVVSQVD